MRAPFEFLARTRGQKEEKAIHRVRLGQVFSRRSLEEHLLIPDEHSSDQHAENHTLRETVVNIRFELKGPRP